MVHHFAFHEVSEGGCEVLHPFIGAVLHDLKEILFSAFEDVFLHNRGVEQDFKSRGPRHFWLQGGQQPLVDDGLQVVGQQFADLFSLAFWEGS